MTVLSHINCVGRETNSLFASGRPRVKKHDLNQHPVRHLVLTALLLGSLFLSSCAGHKSADAETVSPPPAMPIPPPPPPPPQPPAEAERPHARVMPLGKAGNPDARPGEPLLVLLEGPVAQLASVSAAFGNTASPVLPPAGGSGDWLGLVPIGRDHEPGKFAVRLAYTYQNGSTTGEEISVAVRPREYPAMRLSVSPDLVRFPPDKEAQVEEDRKAFAAVWEAPARERLWSGRFLMPTDGRVSATFGDRRTYNGDVKGRHSGIDIAAPTGAAVRAANAGRVVLVRLAYVEGRTVVIDHGGGVFTFYCHLSRARVEVGDGVERGQRIGDVGETGRATGPHLHFGARVAGERVDPLGLFRLRPEEGEGEREKGKRNNND